MVRIIIQPHIHHKYIIRDNQFRQYPHFHLQDIKFCLCISDRQILFYRINKNTCHTNKSSNKPILINTIPIHCATSCFLLSQRIHLLLIISGSHHSRNYALLITVTKCPNSTHDYKTHVNSKATYHTNTKNICQHNFNLLYQINMKTLLCQPNTCSFLKLLYTPLHLLVNWFMPYFTLDFCYFYLLDK